MVYIYIRKTIDWEDEQEFWAQIRPEFKSRVELWNKTFTMPYCQFRYHLKQIAQLNISKIQNSVCGSWEDIPDGALVIPVDDDDWFSPELGILLEQNLIPGVAGYYWPCNFIETSTSIEHKFWLIRRKLHAAQIWICTTNNYAVVKTPEAKILADNHIRASEWFGENESRIRKISDHLSIMNRTLASQTSLASQRYSIKRLALVRRFSHKKAMSFEDIGNPWEAPASRSKLVRKFWKYKKLYAKPLAPELNWAQPYMQMMADIMDQLKLRM